MTCQHCQTQNCETQILDDDYRCRRCGSRVRSTPLRPLSESFPVQTGATARAFETHSKPFAQIDNPRLPAAELGQAEQARLFDGTETDARVIAFDSLTTRAERQSIHARAAGLSRPEPLRTEKVEVKRVRPLKAVRSGGANQFANVSRRIKPSHYDQQQLEFQSFDNLQPAPAASIICDAPVAPASMRLQATMIDCIIIAAPCSFTIVLFILIGGSFNAADKFALPMFAIGLATIPFFYKLLWAFAGCDSIGMQRAGLQLVDFDGNPPSQSRRYQRFAGSLLSLLAAGIGLIWALVDEDRLTWHDHISNTFPTLIADEPAE